MGICVVCTLPCPGVTSRFLCIKIIDSKIKSLVKMSSFLGTWFTITRNYKIVRISVPSIRNEYVM